VIAPVTNAQVEEVMERAVDVKGRSLWDDARRRLFRNRAALISIIVLGVIALAAIFGPFVLPFTFEQQDYNVVACAPNWWPDTAVMCNAGAGHWFGTDNVGRDLLARTLFGARISLAVGLIATLVSLIIGVAYGATAGFIGGRIDELMMRFVDVLYSIPYIFLVIILMVIFNRNFFLLFVAIGAVEWLTMARIVRGQTLSVKQKEFVEAARAGGVGTFGIIVRHIVPNVFGPVIVYVTLTVPASILAESFLSYLGLGIQEPLTSWGVLIKDGADQMETAPWTLIFPAAFMAVTLFCFNFIGDGLRDALDPKDR
jgi:oligopeptide transport system permease protein